MHNSPLSSGHSLESRYGDLIGWSRLNVSKVGQHFAHLAGNALQNRIDVISRAVTLGVHPGQLRLLIQGESRMIDTKSSENGECYYLFLEVTHQIQACMQMMSDRTAKDSGHNNKNRRDVFKTFTPETYCDLL